MSKEERVKVELTRLEIPDPDGVVGAGVHLSARVEGQSADDRGLGRTKSLSLSALGLLHQIGEVLVAASEGEREERLTRGDEAQNRMVSLKKVVHT